MDPDNTLIELRLATRAWEKAIPGTRAEQEAAERATGAASALDDWLSKGGFLPEAWSAAQAPSGAKAASGA